ncbi:hypothetical protein evm_015485 [Chilo suppressalis]|nr:hypothetical protein evm_015485 [Chilo suppressalis]
MSALSRKRRIMDLALNLDNKDNYDSTSNRNTHDENSNLEPEDPCDTAMSSPLPPEARNIREDMAEQVTSSPAPLLHNLTNEDVLTPLNIEVPSSFNNSPAFYLEEFEEPQVSTPSSSQMVLATPMPSPLNAHKKCCNEFCSIHCSWLDSVQCLVAKAKYKDLVSMCDTGVIGPSNATFFKSLPYNSEDCNNGQDDDVNDKE